MKSEYVYIIIAFIINIIMTCGIDIISGKPINYTINFIISIGVPIVLVLLFKLASYLIKR